MSRAPLYGLRPVAELAASRPHGDRLRYLAGCRCDACRAANTAYERSRVVARRSGDWNGIVPADRARAHLHKLSRLGVGKGAVADATDLAISILHQIRQGQRTQIRARTERKILCVSRAQLGDAALIDAGPTWRLVEHLLDEGYTKLRIARELGQKGNGLQLGKTRITVRNAARLAAVHRRLTT